MTNASTPLPLCETDSQRLHAVDALRGFALLAIVILHCIEHYNVFMLPEWQPAWLNRLDTLVMDTVWFLMAGKAYATFSLLFGLSFYIQMRNARRRGDDFRLRFAWRMVILVLIAQLHALFYNGDILVFYAFCGLILIPASSWSNRTVLIVAGVLLLQPIDWIHMITAWINPEYIDMNSRFARFASQAEQVAMHGDLIQTLSDNIINGQLYSNFWQVEAGRICQTPALFLLGMWLGRKEYFLSSPQSAKFWTKVLIWSIIWFAVLHTLKTIPIAHLSHPTWISHFGIALGMPSNFAMMAGLVAAFMLLWFHASDRGYSFQRLTVNYGRMSLTNYVSQSIIGVCLFYNFGLGLYRYCGATLSLLIALTIVAAQIAFSNYWIPTHRQGPLERIWKRLTWLGSSRLTPAPGPRA